MNCKIFEIMKSYTDLEQFKKLAEILPIESADMFYSYIVGIERYYGDVPRVVQVNNHFIASINKVMRIYISKSNINIKAFHR